MRTIKDLIVTIRDRQCLLDADVAMLYGYETKVINQTVKRNIKRFPEEFCFQLTKEEYEGILKQKGGVVSRSQFVTLNRDGEENSSRSQFATLNRQEQKGMRSQFATASGEPKEEFLRSQFDVCQEKRTNLFLYSIGVSPFSFICGLLLL